jgi:hypothetical protein
MTWSLLAGGGEYPVQDGFGWSNGIVEIDDREIVLQVGKRKPLKCTFQRLFINN